MTTLPHPHEVPNPEPCAPPFIPDALFPVSLTLMLVFAAVTAALTWAHFRYDLPGHWPAIAGALTLAAGFVAVMARQTC